LKSKALKIAEHLTRYQQKDGLIDPLLNKPIRNSYGNAFYALLCATIYQNTKYQDTKKKVWLKRAIKAIDNELKSVDNRSKLSGVFRWEFKNYALINSFLILKEELPLKTGKRIVNVLTSWLNTCSFQSNWVAMRMLNHHLRYLTFGKKKDLMRSSFEAKILLRRQLKNGFFPDDINSNSFQYHAYVLSLLYQYYDLTKNERIKQAFLKGVDFIISFINPEGDFSYYGRGQEQIFGYGALIHSLSGAYKITTDPKYSQLAKLVFSYSNKYNQRDNKKNNNGTNKVSTNWPIVINNSEDKKAGWYLYNNKIDYLSFYALYLLLASKNLKEKAGLKRKVNTKEKTLNNNQNYNHFHTQNYIAIAAGGKDSSEIGGIANIFPKVFPTQGGPPTFLSKEQRDYSLNYLGPLFKSKNPIFQKAGKTIVKKNFVKLIYNLEKFNLTYFYDFNQGVKLEVCISPKEEITIVPLHLISFNKPNVNTNANLDLNLKLTEKGEIYTPDGVARIYESKEIKIRDPFKYNLQLSKNPSVSHIFSRKISFVQWAIYKFNKTVYLGLSLLFKLLFRSKDFSLLLKYYKSTKRYYQK
jgi:hypothetical protein